MKKLSAITLQRGFTLVELLTVISIIAILTAILTVSFVSVSQRSRDGQRKASIRQIQSALELFRADNGSYPQQGTGNIISGTTCNNAFTHNSITYMQRMPCDPETSTRYYYLASPTGCSPTGTICQSYRLSSCLDNSGDREGVTTSPGSGFTCSNPALYFTVTNP